MIIMRAVDQATTGGLVFSREMMWRGALRSLRVPIWLPALWLLVGVTSCSAPKDHVVKLTIATVGNPDTARMRALSDDFEHQHPNIHLNWIVLEENSLRQRATTDVATRGGQFDIVTIGPKEIPIWAQLHWLQPLNDLGAAYDAADLLTPIRGAVSLNGVQYGSPFLGEGSFTIYRKDLFRQAGLVMPPRPSWSFIANAARKLNDPVHGIYGICLRGRPGRSGNMAPITAIANAYGTRLFDKSWRPQFDTPQWHRALQFYVDLLRAAGPPGVAANGFLETVRLFAAGRCAISFDSTAAASFLSDPRTSAVAEKTGFVGAPDAGLGLTSDWLWTWALAIPTSSEKAATAKIFIAWATGPDYARLVANRFGWMAAPPGTRRSLYENQAYLTAAPFARISLQAIIAGDPRRPGAQSGPYTAVQYAAIPEFQAIADEVGQHFAAGLSGDETVDQALQSAQTSARRQMVTHSSE